MVSLQSVIGRAVASPYCYPKNRAERRRGVVKTVGYTCLGTVSLMGALTLLTEMPWSRRIQWSLVAGSTWGLPMGAISAFLYTKLTLPPQESWEVVEIASGAAEDQLRWIKGDQEKEVAAEAVRYAKSLDAIAGLHAFVSRAHACDFSAPLLTRLRSDGPLALFAGMGVGIAVWTFVLSGGVADSALSGSFSFFNKEVLRTTAQAAAGMGIGLGAVLLASILFGQPGGPLREMPGTKHWTKVARNLGDVEGKLRTFYATEKSGGDRVKSKIYELLGVEE